MSTLKLENFSGKSKRIRKPRGIVNTTRNTLEKLMKRTIEIKGAEGGTDAKLFAKDLASAYISLATRLG